MLFFFFIVLLLFYCAAKAKDISVGKDGFSTITEAVEKAQPGDTLRVSPGLYTENTESFPIVIDKPLKIIGETGTVLESPPFIPLLKVEVEGVSVENIDFRLLRWGIVGLADRLSIKNCKFTLFDDTYRVSSCGIWLAGMKNATLQDNRFYGCGVCIAGVPINENSDSKPVLTGLFEVGDDTEYFSSHMFINNFVNDKPLYYFNNAKNLTVPEDAGQVIVVCSENVSINNIDASDCSMGLIVAHCKNVNVAHTNTDRCGLFGIYLAYVDHGKIGNSTVRESNHAMDFRASKHLLIENCSVESSDQGIFFSFVDNSRVLYCDVTSTGQGYFFAAGNLNSVVQCKVVNCENGMNLQKENDISIINNYFEGNSVCALRVDRSPSAIVNNYFYQNWVDVMAYSDVSIILTNNIFCESKSCGLYLRDISYSVIECNTFENCLDSSIQIQGKISDTSLENNTVGK